MASEDSGCRVYGALGPPGEGEAPPHFRAHDCDRVQFVGVQEGRRLRYSGGPKPAPGQLRDDLEVARLKSDAWLKTCHGASGVKAGAYAGAPGQTNQRSVLNCFQGNSVSGGQRILIANRNDNRLFYDDVHFDARWRSEWQANNRHVELPRAEGIDQVLSVGFGQGDVHGRVVAVEAGQEIH